MENSMSALRRAVEEGYRYLEIDVHSTSDGVVVVCHDPTLDRTTDRTGAIADQPWARVREALIGGREPLPTLRQVLDELPGALLNVDVKADSAVRPTLRLLDETDAWHRVGLASFSHQRLSRLRAAGGARVVTSCSPRDALSLRLRGWLRRARLGPVAAALPVPAELAQLPRTRGPVTVVDRSLVEAAHALGIEVHVWTVNDPDQMRELLDIGVDGLVTDRPDLLREVLTAQDRWPDR
jgi:glycerophosphoryl diester phosphodiesterase